MDPSAFAPGMQCTIKTKLKRTNGASGKIVRVLTSHAIVFLPGPEPPKQEVKVPLHNVLLAQALPLADDAGAAPAEVPPEPAQKQQKTSSSEAAAFARAAADW